MLAMEISVVFCYLPLLSIIISSNITSLFMIHMAIIINFLTQSTMYLPYVYLINFITLFLFKSITITTI